MCNIIGENEYICMDYSKPTQCSIHNTCSTHSVSRGRDSIMCSASRRVPWFNAWRSHSRPVLCIGVSGCGVVWIDSKLLSLSQQHILSQQHALSHMHCSHQQRHMHVPRSESVAIVAFASISSTTLCGTNCFKNGQNPCGFGGN